MTWPDEQTERTMLEDARLLESEFEPTSAGHDAACHIKALLSRVRELEQELAAMKKQWNDLDTRTERNHLEWTVKLLGLQGLLRELTDPDPCNYDHHGYCQAHSLGEKPCPHERAKKILRDRPKEPK